MSQLDLNQEISELLEYYTNECERLQTESALEQAKLDNRMAAYLEKRTAYSSACDKLENLVNKINGPEKHNNCGYGCDEHCLYPDYE